MVKGWIRLAALGGMATPSLSIGDGTICVRKGAEQHISSMVEWQTAATQPIRRLCNAHYTTSFESLHVIDFRDIATLSHISLSCRTIYCSYVSERCDFLRVLSSSNFATCLTTTFLSDEM